MASSDLDLRQNKTPPTVTFLQQRGLCEPNDVWEGHT